MYFFIKQYINISSESNKKMILEVKIGIKNLLQEVVIYSSYSIDKLNTLIINAIKTKDSFCLNDVSTKSTYIFQSKFITYVKISKENKKSFGFATN